MPGRPGAAASLERVIAAMTAKQRHLGGRLHADLTDHIPSYRAVPRELLDQIWHRYFQRALAVLREGTVPAPEDFDEADVAGDRAARGVPLRASSVRSSSSRCGTTWKGGGTSARSPAAHMCMSTPSATGCAVSRS
ncbi:hypothetical protein [Streptomyces sp. NPDC006739]|uniref:hypothetical protein n=1 Tax=Streptomyces sp. NPDC006739 TaxID=3364763 RepID=UPI00369F5CDE